MRARMITDYLRRNGLSAVLFDAETTVMMPVTGGARVSVPDDEEHQARRLLAELDEEIAREEEREDPS